MAMPAIELLALGSGLRNHAQMIIGKSELESALREVPFTIHMVDGRDYRVTDASQVHIGGAHIVFVDSRVIPHMLPLLTMTGISYGTVPKTRKK